VAAIVAELEWQGPVYGISALTADGTKRLVQDAMTYLEAVREEEKTAQPSLQGA
jgi:GTP-binding protein